MITSIKLAPKLPTPKNKVTQKQNHKNFFDVFAQQQSFKNLDDWYKVDKSLLEKHGGSFIFNSRKTLYRVLQNAYPEHEWIPWKFDRVPRGFWRDISNQRWFFDWLGKELGITQLDDWYSLVSSKQVVEKGGVGLMHLYNNSVISALEAVYPNHRWIRWNFAQSRAPAHFWGSSDNHRKYFDWLGNELGIKNMDDWYSLLTRENITKYRGAGIVGHNSLYTALMEAYPEHNWQPWKFDKTFASFWKELSNQRKFLEWLASELGIQTMEDWYKVTADKVSRKGGAGLLTLHRFSMHSMLSTAYPHYPWKPWNFEKISKFWTNDSSVVHAFISDLADRLHVVQLEDWYRVSTIQLLELRALSRVKSLGGLATMLKKLYPDYNWSSSKFNARAKRSSQRWMLVAVKKLFPSQEVKEDYLPSDLKFADTERHIQLDVFVPAHNVAFEYQGKQHYMDISYFGPQQRYHNRDLIKRDICASHGITLIEVPYWWDGQVSSLASTLASIRKDIPLSEELLRNAKPIPSRKS